jgi:hypothetical protein
MNIVDGDIDNEVGSQFIGNGPYTELRQFHMEQVQEGRQIIQKNLENLQQLFTLRQASLANCRRRHADVRMEILSSLLRAVDNLL